MSFSFHTVQNFESHIRRSIPGYEELHKLTVSLSSHFLPTEGGLIYDLGCSTGELLGAFYAYYGDAHTYIGIDNSSHLLPPTGRKGPKYRHGDLEDVKPSRTDKGFIDVVTCLFTLQFLSHEGRFNLLRAVGRCAKPTGCLIVAEKCTQESGFEQELFNGTLFDFKRLNGFSGDEILDKEASLRHLMKPCSADQNEKLFRKAGFTRALPFWQNLHFRAWLLTK